MQTELTRTLPQELEVTMISSVTGQGITELKDKLWNELQQKNNTYSPKTANRHENDC
jgi:selenocysteine-specific translation elongation factor